MIRWIEREDAYRLTVSWGDRKAMGVLALAWALLVSFALGAPKDLFLPLLAGACLLLLPIGLAFLRGARNGAWIDVDARGGYASWCTTGLSPQESPVGVTRFAVDGRPGAVCIVAVLPSGERRVALCRADLPQGVNAHEIVERLNELLHAVPAARPEGEESST